MALSADGNTLAVSAYFEGSRATGVNGNQADNSKATWTFQSYLKGSNTEKFDEFGSGVSLSRHGTLAVGARMEDSGSKGASGNGDDNSVTDSGAVYLFSY